MLSDIVKTLNVDCSSESELDEKINTLIDVRETIASAIIHGALEQLKALELISGSYEYSAESHAFAVLKHALLAVETDVEQRYNAARAEYWGK